MTNPVAELPVSTGGAAGQIGAVVDGGLEKIIDKLQKLSELRRARDKVKRLERELSGLPATPAEASSIPEFLRARTPLQARREPAYALTMATPRRSVP